jgi:hypothetical protein
MLRRRRKLCSRIGQISAVIAFTLAAPAIAQDSPTGQNVSAARQLTVSSQQPNQLPPGNKADGPNTDVNWSRVGMGFTTAVGNLFYIPAKLAYGTLGSVAGGAAYVFSHDGHSAAHQIWRNSLGGDYVLTPEMLTGHEPIHFMGSVTQARPHEAAPQVSQPGKVQPESFAAASGSDRSSRTDAPAGQTNFAYRGGSTLEIPHYSQMDHSDLSEQEIPPSEPRSRDSEALPRMSIEPQ